MPKLLIKFDARSNRLLILEDGQLDLSLLGDTSALRRQRIGQIDPCPSSPSHLEVLMKTPAGKKKKLPFLFLKKKDAVAAEIEEAKSLYFTPAQEKPSPKKASMTEDNLPCTGLASAAPCPFCGVPIHAEILRCKQDAAGNTTRAVFLCNCPLKS